MPATTAYHFRGRWAVSLVLSTVLSLLSLAVKAFSRARLSFVKPHACWVLVRVLCRAKRLESFTCIITLAVAFAFWLSESWAWIRGSCSRSRWAESSLVQRTSIVQGLGVRRAWLLPECPTSRISPHSRDTMDFFI